VRFKDRFDELFAGMDIHRDDTRDKTRQGSFPDGHPDVLQASDYDKAVDSIHKRNFLSSLTRVNQVVSMRLGGTLMVLVDEYDRAPMSALVSAEGSLDVERYNKAKELLRDFLGALKAIHEDDAHFFVTGITPVAIAGESIWNSADHFTFHTEFADMLGLTRVDVEAGLRQVAKIKDEKELQRALEVATRLYNGTHFSNSKQDLFNPQMVVKFLELYRPEKLRDKICDDESLRRNFT
jgi:hypothetical protein